MKRRVTLSNKTEGVFTAIDYKKKKYKTVYVIMFAILLIAALATFFPIFWLLMTSFKTVEELFASSYSFWPDSISWSRVTEVWGVTNFSRAYINSLIVVGGAVVVSVVANGLLAFVLSIVRPKGHRAVFVLIMMGYMIPPITGMIPLFVTLRNMQLIDTFVPPILMFGANAFYLVMFKSYMESLPKAIFEAAEVDGAKMMTVFFKIVFPLSLPIVGVIAILTATAAWNDFLFQYLILRSDSVQTVIVRLFHLNRAAGMYQHIYMAMMLATLPLIVLFLIFQRQITSTVTTSGIK